MNLEAAPRLSDNVGWGGLMVFVIFSEQSCIRFYTHKEKNFVNKS